MEVTGLTTAFDALICAHDIGYPKEDPRFWPLLEQDESFDSQNTLFIDDNLSILRTARDYGIRHLLAVRKPDSRSAPRDSEEFRAINSFDEIMPPGKVKDKK
jgi:putative hydrolase of the HAD superfamily